MPSADRRTLFLLAWRHLLVQRSRGLFLLFGYAVGAGVMMVLLSIGEAMLVQSRDVSLVGGGEVTVLPEGIDLEGLRTGSVGGLFLSIDRARFLQRQLLGGGRLADAVGPISPAIERKLVYLVRDGGLVPLRAGAELPGAARAVGAGLELLDGRWEDSPADRAFASPTPEQLYHELDRWHSPRPDSSWAEWQYFNVSPSPDEWWYITFLIGGLDRDGRPLGQLLVTRYRAGLPPARFLSVAAAAAVRYDTTTADLDVGSATVRQRAGHYRIVGQASGTGGAVSFDLEVAPTPNAYFPAVELTADRFVSGYVVPAIRATAAGTICEQRRCRRFENMASYHDHNWGVWRQTTWNWGQARGSQMSVVYGGVLTGDSVASNGGSPYFLAVVDSAGVRQILRFRRIEYQGRHPVAPGIAAPDSFRLVAVREPDTLNLAVTVRRAQVTASGIASKAFLQMRGDFRISGQLLGHPVADSGLGFFETFVAPKARR